MSATAHRDRLLTLRQDLTTAIAANEAYRGDPLLLAGITSKLRYWLRTVETGLSQPYRTEDIANQIGPDWHGPGIADLIDTSARLRNPWAGKAEEGFRVEMAA